jgi:DNA repair protein RadD
MKLRPYQITIVNQIYDAWNRVQNVGVQLATGGGKTAIFSHIIADYTEPSLVVAHRTELVSQTSLTLSQYGIRHNIIAPLSTIREIVSLHMQMYGQSYYDPQAYRYVAGIDTLLNRVDKMPFLKRIKLLIQDEGHHCLRANKWGKAAELFPAAYGLYPTATPLRADGKGLGRHAQGVIDELVIGVSMSELIVQGYLTDYRIIAPPNHLDLTHVNITAGGDYSPQPLRAAVSEARITGDVVEHYKRYADGELGITFCVDVESSHEIANAYRRAGVMAEVINAKTPALARATIMRRFRNREILQLVNVDILGEGVDVPAVTVVSMCRPTASYNIYAQQFGRALRPAENKPYAIIIDHVNNYQRHGLPDSQRNWSLDARSRRTRSTTPGILSLRVCLNSACLAVYRRLLNTCPYCGYVHIPRERSSPEHVDGDLLELDESTLMRLRGEVARIDSAPRIPRGVSVPAQIHIANVHTARQEAQRELRARIATWAGILHAQGISDGEIYRRFYLTHGVDILSAQALSTVDANTLRDAIDITTNNTE